MSFHPPVAAADRGCLAKSVIGDFAIVTIVGRALILRMRIDGFRRAVMAVIFETRQIVACIPDARDLAIGGEGIG